MVPAGAGHREPEPPGFAQRRKKRPRAWSQPQAQRLAGGQLGIGFPLILFFRVGQLGLGVLRILGRLSDPTPSSGHARRSLWPINLGLVQLFLRLVTASQTEPHPSQAPSQTSTAFIDLAFWTLGPSLYQSLGPPKGPFAFTPGT